MVVDKSGAFVAGMCCRIGVKYTQGDPLHVQDFKCVPDGLLQHLAAISFAADFGADYDHFITVRLYIASKFALTISSIDIKMNS